MAFNSQPTSGGSSNIFGQNSNLGDSTVPNKSPLFGHKTATSASSGTDSNVKPSQSLFGGISNTKLETSSSTPSISNNSTEPTTGGLFSIPKTASTGFSFGQSQVTASQNQSNAPSLPIPTFGNIQTTGSSVFKKISSGETLEGTSTPVKQLSFNTSTTPAGPPPTDKNPASTSSTLFGTGNKLSEGSVFGGSKLDSNSLFNKGGNSLFSPAKLATQPSTSNSPLASKLTSPSLNNTNTITPAAQKSESSTSLKLPASTSQKLSGLTPKTDLFSIPTISEKNSGASSSATTTALSSSAPFSFAAATGIKRGASNSSNTPISTTLGSVSTSTPATESQTKKETEQAGNSGNTVPYGSSTAGPTPQLTRLKNKTMDEIITRWASDLSKYQKEFQEQAGKVAAWDRLMVENGEKIQKLYLSTFEAERQNAEIERQLLSVESQQDEVASWLEKYESEIDEMFSRQIAQSDALQGPDQEREKTYKLAEKLTDRLDEMGKNITSMIDAINDASSILGKTGKADDPLSSIVRVLNNHLTTLQWIDENAEVLKSKLDEAQKIGKDMGYNDLIGLESESADHFYRSLMSHK